MNAAPNNVLTVFRSISFAALALAIGILMAPVGYGAPAAADPVQTATFAQYWGSITIAGSDAPVGTLVEVYNPRGNLAGKFVVHTAGTFGYMRVFGEDASASPPIPGMRNGEAINFKVNGVLAASSPAVTWQNNINPTQVNLAAGSAAAITPPPTATFTPLPTSAPTRTLAPTATPAPPAHPDPISQPEPTEMPRPTQTPFPSATLPAAAPTNVPPVPTAVQSGRQVNQARYFTETGYQVARDGFWDYFTKRGSIRTFGYPVSREFTLLGFRVQFFQRAILQWMPDGTVARMNLLDEGLMPYTQINYSTYPAADPDLMGAAPSPADPDYGDKAIAFLREHVPDRWDGQSVNFLSTFMSTVRYEDAFPQGDGSPSLVPLLNLEVWGLPTSRPAYDPSNRNFIYQRFQRGILHYDATTGATQGMLLADYLKSIMTGENLPEDLEEQARDSRYYRQFAPGMPGSVARPGDLPNSDLAGAFERE